MCWYRRKVVAVKTMSLKGIHLIHSFAYFSPSQPHQIFRLLYIYMYIYTMPSIAQYLSICCVYSLELYSWHLTACITSSCPSSHCHHLLRPFCIVALIIYEMLHSLPTHHHCISLHQLLHLVSSWQWESTRTKSSRIGRWHILQVLTSHDPI